MDIRLLVVEEHTKSDYYFLCNPLRTLNVKITRVINKRLLHTANSRGRKRELSINFEVYNREHICLLHIRRDVNDPEDT